jgi:predicted DNA-binding protein
MSNDSDLNARFPTVTLRLPSPEWRDRLDAVAGSTGAASVGAFVRDALIAAVERAENEGAKVEST